MNEPQNNSQSQTQGQAQGQTQSQTQGQTQSNPTLQAFFVGRALAESLRDQAEMVLTNLLSDVGKFDAEQRENLRHFTEQVLVRASQDASQGPAGATSATPEDLQASLDDLRAEIAQLRAALQAYRTQTPS